jgi:putative flippase GtrA
MIFFNSKFTTLYKYLLIGGVNTAFGYSVFAILLFFGLHYSLAVLVGTILGVLFNFQSYGRLVFQDYSWNLLSRFVFVYTIIYFANITLLLIFDLVVSNLYISGLMVLPIIAYLGYFFNKRYVWKKS